MRRIGLTELRFFLVGIIFLLMVLINCNKEEPIPAYIHIDKIDLTTVYADQGSNSHKIIDAWIYIDDQFAGAYEMPCTIPVLYQGSHTLKITPGIKENGISETRVSYIFYNTCEQAVTLTPGKVTTCNPTTTYSKGADFSWLENFEGSSTGICNSLEKPDTVMRIVTTPNEVFELAGSAKVELTAGQGPYLGVSCDKYVLPQKGMPVFLELNYNCNTDFNIGVMGYAGTTVEYKSVVLTLRPTKGWNKIYVSLTSAITSATTSTKFGIFFSMVKNADLPTSYFYLDNVKLIN